MTKRREILDQPLPKSVEIERELLLALFVSGSVSNLEGLHQRDFTDELHVEVFKAMKAVSAAGIVELEVEPVLVQVGAGKRRDLVVTWLENYRNSHGVPANIPYYKKSLRELRRRRALISVACDLLKNSYDTEMAVGDTRAWLTRQLDLIDAL